MLYMYNCITLLYSRSEHNIVSQPYFYLKKKMATPASPMQFGHAIFLRKNCELETRETPQISLVCVYSKALSVSMQFYLTFARTL